MRLERWRLAPSLITAAELVEICVVEGREREAVDAARRLVNIDRNAAPLIREHAALLLERNGFGDDVPVEARGAQPIDRSPRLLTRIHPHDPIAWVELSLRQTIHGSTKAAKRSMSVALRLAPHNRHVLRSAARLLLHCDDPERALAIVSRNEATKSDPWLMASEIALAHVAGYKSRFLKAASTMLSDRKYHPRHVTELAGAVATEDLAHGKRKMAKRAFLQSLTDPTGSSLAQGEWATDALGGDLVSEAQLLSTFENDEARAFHLYRMGKLELVGEACERWSENDPFSVRPFEFGAASAGLIEDFEGALAFAAKGLKIRPTLTSLLNTKAFAAASLGQVDEAADALNKIKPGDATKMQQLVATANRGLIAFRRKQEDAGRALYAEAIDGFKRDGSEEFSARARLYLAREAMIAGAEDWPKLLKDAKEAMSKFKDSEATPVLRELEKKAAAALPDTKAEPKPVEPREEPTKPTIRVTYGATPKLQRRLK